MYHGMSLYMWCAASFGELQYTYHYMSLHIWCVAVYLMCCSVLCVLQCRCIMACLYICGVLRHLASCSVHIFTRLYIRGVLQYVRCVAICNKVYGRVRSRTQWPLAAHYGPRCRVAPQTPHCNRQGGGPAE